jgi:hypothetical protein
MTTLRSHRPGFRVRTILGLLTAILVIGTLSAASSGAASASSDRRGALHMTKECSEYTGQADSFCTITSSNLKAIKAGSRVVYLQAAGATSLDSDLVLVVGPGNYALGHVRLDFTTGTGVVRFWGGIGDFSDFHARAVVSHLDGVNWAWDGKYHFDD